MNHFSFFDLQYPQSYVILVSLLFSLTTVLLEDQAAPIFHFERPSHKHVVQLCRITGPINDIHVFEVDNATWTDLTHTIVGTPPSKRFTHGFAAVGGQLYVFGGCTAEQGGIWGTDGELLSVLLCVRSLTAF